MKSENEELKIDMDGVTLEDEDYQTFLIELCNEILSPLFNHLFNCKVQHINSFIGEYNLECFEIIFMYLTL